MRRLSLWALGLMALTALLAVTSSASCKAMGYSNCFNVRFLAMVLGFIGVALAFIATLVSVVRTVKRHQWAWLIGLVPSFLALPVGLILDAQLSSAVYSDIDPLQNLPLGAALLLPPAVAFSYSWRHPGSPTTERPSWSVVLLRAFPLVALPCLTFSAFLVVGANRPCAELECLNTGGAAALAGLLGLIGFVLTGIATNLASVRAKERLQRGWVNALVICLLAPLPGGLFLSFALGGVYGDNRLLQDLPTCAGLVLTPVVVLIYSWRFPRGAAAERSVPLPAAETLEEPAPPPLDAP